MKLQRLEPFLWTLVAGTIVCVLMVNWRIFHDRPDRLSDEAMVIAVQCLMTALPFVVVARAARYPNQHLDLERSPKRLVFSAIAAFSVTIASWMAYGYDGINAQHSNGASIGLGWLMLASPIVAAGILYAGFRTGSARNHSKPAA